MDIKDILSDIITHANDFKRAIAIARDSALTADDSSYWVKQAATYDKIEAVAKVLVGDVKYEELSLANLESYIENIYDRIEIMDRNGIYIEQRYSHPWLNPRDITILLLMEANYQVFNGGINQYICNRYANAQDIYGNKASFILTKIANAFEDQDPELSRTISSIGRLARKYHDIDTYKQDKFDYAMSEFKDIEEAYYGFTGERIRTFFVNIANKIDTSLSPFAGPIKRKDAEYSPAPSI